MAVEFRVVPKLNHPVIFGISWFAEFNPHIDWYNHSIQLDLDEENILFFLHMLQIHFLVLIYILLTNLVNCLVTLNHVQLLLLLAFPMLRHLSTYCSLMHIGISHPSLLSWLSS